MLFKQGVAFNYEGAKKIYIYPPPCQAGMKYAYVELLPDQIAFQSSNLALLPVSRQLSV